MNGQNNNRHLVDILFVLGLFAAFTLCSIFLIILGSHLYQKNVNEMDKNYAERTSFCYFTEKLRQSDSETDITIQTFHDKNVLCISQQLSGSLYLTYLYEDEGYLKELFTRYENPFLESSGTPILPLSDLVIEEVDYHLYHIQFFDEEHDYVNFYINTVS